MMDNGHRCDTPPSHFLLRLSAGICAINELCSCAFDLEDLSSSEEGERNLALILNAQRSGKEANCDQTPQRNAQDGPSLLCTIGKKTHRTQTPQPQ
jgi:hypothetical protein